MTCVLFELTSVDSVPSYSKERTCFTHVQESINPNYELNFRLLFARCQLARSLRGIRKHPRGWHVQAYYRNERSEGTAGANWAGRYILQPPAQLGRWAVGNDHSTVKWSHVDFVSVAAVTVRDDGQHGTLGEHGPIISLRRATLHQSKYLQQLSVM